MNHVLKPLSRRDYFSSLLSAFNSLMLSQKSSNSIAVTLTITAVPTQGKACPAIDATFRDADLCARFETLLAVNMSCSPKIGQ
jgi:hypothetical protein